MYVVIADVFLVFFCIFFVALRVLFFCQYMLCWVGGDGLRLSSRQEHLWWTSYISDWVTFVR